MAMDPQPVTADSEGEGVDTGLDPSDELRGHVYSLLAALLARPPSQELLELLRGIEAPQNGQSDMEVAWRMVKLAAEQATVEGTDDEYHDLFIGISRGELVPYGSWYMTGLLMDKPLALLRRDLAVLGFERQSHTHEPEDHVAALCEILAMANQRQTAVPLSKQTEFFNEHLAPWIGVFFRDLQGAQSACFYRAIGQLGESFVKVEKQYLQMPV